MCTGHPCRCSRSYAAHPLQLPSTGCGHMRLRCPTSQGMEKCAGNHFGTTSGLFLCTQTPQIQARHFALRLVPVKAVTATTLHPANRGFNVPMTPRAVRMSLGRWRSTTLLEMSGGQIFSPQSNIQPMSFPYYFLHQEMTHQVNVISINVFH